VLEQSQLAGHVIEVKGINHLWNGFAGLREMIPIGGIGLEIITKGKATILQRKFRKLCMNNHR